MRLLLDITMPNEPFNTYAREGIVGQKIGDILETIRPEAAYFTERDGKRGAFVVVDVADPSRIPTYAEPWFLGFGADVKLRVAMTPAELNKSGLENIAKKYR